MVLFASVCLGASTLLCATEPRGFVSMVPSWQEDAAVNSPPVLKMVVQPDISLENAVFQVRFPDSVLVQPSGSSAGRFHPVEAPKGYLAFAVDLGSLAASDLAAFEFTPSGYESRGVILGFILQGTTADGKGVQEAVGVPAGHPGSRGTRKFGAIEFPAVPMPEPPQ